MKKKGIKGKLKALLVLILQSGFLAGVTIFGAAPAGCKLNDVTDSIEGDFNSPTIDGVTVIDEKRVEIDFSEEVIVTSASVTKTEELSEAGGEAGFSEFSGNISVEGSKVIVNIPAGTETGKNYIISGNVEDKNGNTLGFSIPFVGYNGNLAKILMTEIQTETVSSRTNKEKEMNYYRGEFVEFLALNDGNLSGLELVSVYDGEDKKFVFPNLEVKAGEIFVVHLRKHGDGCISENEEDLALAKAPYSSDEIRDLWSSEENTVLGNKTDIVFVRNSADDSILDAIMYRDKNVTEWKENYAAYAEKVEKAGIFGGSTIDFAVDASGKSNSKTLTRKNAAELRKSVLFGEEIEYPVGVSSDSWEVSTVSCGKISD